MATQQQIQEARKRLETKFATDGACRSCGWRALLYEHDVTDEDIANALDNESGVLRLYCQSDDSAGHRGARIRIDA